MLIYNPASPYNTAKKLADTLQASWVAYQSGASGENAGKLATDFTQAIENARPVLSRLDDGVGILNMLLRFVKEVIKFLLPVKLETDSEKVFKNLDEKMATYKPLRASRAVFFKGTEVSIPKDLPPASEQASRDTAPSAPALEGSPTPEPSAPSLDEDENEPGLQSP